MIIKATIGALICVVLGVVLSKNNKEITLLISLATCCIIFVTILYYLQPVMDFIQRLKLMGNLDSDILCVLLKAIGIVLIGEVTAQICADAGNGALSKVLQLLVTAVVLWLSVPLLNNLMNLLEKILGSI